MTPKINYFTDEAPTIFTPEKFKKIKVNIHLSEVCNFRCKYCFAHFEKHKVLRKESWIKVINNCISSGIVNEINFAGGEPMLFPFLTDLAEYVNLNNVRCSLITNGSLINKEWIIKYAGLFNTIGFSFDSFSENTMRSIGRCTENGKTISAVDIINMNRWIHKYHPSVHIKYNTVVNSYNKTELPAKYFNVRNVIPHRWKILKMSPFANDTYSNYLLTITDTEYFNFIRNNLKILGTEYLTNKILYHINESMEVVAEKDLNGAYIMIDAGGYLVDNTKNTNYSRVINCQTESFAEGLKKLTFAQNIYDARYSN